MSYQPDRPVDLNTLGAAEQLAVHVLRTYLTAQHLAAEQRITQVHEDWHKEHGWGKDSREMFLVYEPWKNAIRHAGELSSHLWRLDSIFAPAEPAKVLYEDGTIQTPGMTVHANGSIGLDNPSPEEFEMAMEMMTEDQ